MIVACALAAGASAADAAPGSATALRVGRALFQIDRAARNDFGQFYGCTVEVMTGPDRYTGRVLLAGRHSGRARRVRGLIRHTGATGFVSIGHVAPRYAPHATARLSDALYSSLDSDLSAEDRDKVRIGERGGDEPSRCPKLTIALRSGASSAALDWARRQQERFGSDRISVFEPGSGPEDL